jgi:peptidoglycan/xylan/chitin deacetylase (PgdA/CDA1 family)
MEINLHSVILMSIDKLGINAVFRFLNRKKMIILWYHGICDDNFTLLKGYDERHIPKSLFHQQLQFLNRKGYSFVNISELVDILSSKKQHKKTIALTFDDGFKNVITNAYPIMKQFHAKGCFYLTSSLIGEKNLLWTDYIETVVRNSKKGKFDFLYQGKKITYQLDTKKSYHNTMKDIKRKLKEISNGARKEHIQQFKDRIINEIPAEFLFSNWEEIRRLDTTILEVGSHTKTHPNCVNIIQENEFIDEIRNSKIEIEQRCDHEIKHFCYPGGSYNDKVIQYVKMSGYTSAVTIDSGFNDQTTDIFKLKRILVSGDFLLFKADISGSLLMINRLRKLFSRKKTSH